jgi:hypothetical protein
MSEESSLILSMPAMSIDVAMSRRQAIVDFTKEVMVKGRDYGGVGGSKPTLLKPGAEKLSSLFALWPDFEPIESVEDWTGNNHNEEPFFSYRYKCTMRRIEDNRPVGAGIGSCNSWEKKYRFVRGNKRNNPQDIVNTIDKMAQKRALVAAVLIAVNASEFFTQDLEDYSDAIDGQWEPTNGKPGTTAKPLPTNPTPVAKEVEKALDTDDKPTNGNGKIMGAVAFREWVADKAGFNNQHHVMSTAKNLGYKLPTPSDPEERKQYFEDMMLYRWLRDSAQLDGDESLAVMDSPADKAIALEKMTDEADPAEVAE